MTRSVLVIGGAGYIGSHMVRMLAGRGYRTTVVDNLSRGHRDAVMTGEFIKGDILSTDDLRHVFRDRAFDLVMHFAALSYVGESVENPRRYYENNVIGSMNLLNAMLDSGTDKLVFSSTCAIYGDPQVIPMKEDHPQSPVNPYGQSKLMVERMLADYGAAHGLKSISLRYFNAAGCDPEGVLGERHDPETHLIPRVLQEALRIRKGGRPEDTELCIFGDDYDTADGTCIRDYIHVHDLCAAHLAALERLNGDTAEGVEAYNLGNGRGFSVKAVIDACCRVSGVDIRYLKAARRPGDPACLVGSSDKARSALNWQPRYSDLDAIIETAWRWFSKNETGDVRGEIS